MEDNNPHFKVTREEFKSDIRGRPPESFLQKFDRGKGISMARAEGFELVDQARMVTLLGDLDREGLLPGLDLEDGGSFEQIAKRAMEILRG